MTKSILFERALREANGKKMSRHRLEKACLSETYGTLSFLCKTYLKDGFILNEIKTKGLPIVKNEIVKEVESIIDKNTSEETAKKFIMKVRKTTNSYSLMELLSNTLLAGEGKSIE